MTESPQSNISTPSLTKVFRPRKCAPGFGIPLFEGAGEFFVQRVDASGVSTGFDRCDVDDAHLREVPSAARQAVVDLTVPLFAFEHQDGTLSVGSREEIALELRRVLPELRQHPFIAWDAAEFLQDESLLDELSKMCLLQLDKSNTNSNRPASTDSISMDNVMPNTTSPSSLNFGSFYSEYKKRRAEYGSDTFNCAEETVAELARHATTSDRPGMLLGKVQSGKTRTFISVVALAFDNGYRVAIVLTKNSRALVEQTKKRLEGEFTSAITAGELNVYDIMLAPTSFTAFELESKLILVVKKETNNLDRLLSLYGEHCPAIAKCRAIIIDDEADSASVGYSQQGDVIEANKIATKVSDFRKSIESSSFLQVTATPYSLYLQPDTVSVANSPEFLPIRPAFTKLVPVPSAYVGGETYFGESAMSDSPTVESLIHVAIKDNELIALKEADGRRFKLENALTSSAIEGLRRAICTFIVGGCIQRMTGLANGAPERQLRYSFLLHSETAKGAHAWQSLIVETIKSQLASQASGGLGDFEVEIRNAYEDLTRSIELSGGTVPVFAEVKAAVQTAFSKDYITICKVNSDEQIIAMLDSSGQLKLRSPLNIFIGGQALDRGVTLSNLIGFYYGRRPKKFQQDTVLQHSRMYGYRRADLAVTRFYTTTYVRQAMFEMEVFDSALRSAIDSGDEEVQFIHQAANGKIVPCSPNKILVATTHTLRPFRRLLPIGFQSDYKTRAEKVVREIDARVEALCGFNKAAPQLVELNDALAVLSLIESTLLYEDNSDAKPFDWKCARAVLQHLAQQHPDPAERGKVFVWAAQGRASSRLAAEGSHAKYIETPDSEKTEGRITREFAKDHPIVFFLRQDGKKADGWRDCPFYWPVIRAQQNTKVVVYAAETVH